MIDSRGETEHHRDRSHLSSGGAGKTTFVETFLDRVPNGPRVLWGACDPLSTPRPLGPIRDIADQLGPVTQELLRDGDQPYAIFAAVFDELRTHPTILVIDDLQWADQGSIDLLRFVLRRIGRTGSLIVGIVRDDEIATAHPMRSLLGDAARCSATPLVPATPRRSHCRR